ncbi:hypothetical protein ASPTUDRAFT_188575 [Aspergillus tubingensis CBS 134.48]|uniref:Major facilitator superfamily (MFS) profile domain-containing protein n=1 Tax=Aspergillus tubingensis (strain CBS 134.48) TaxID=767770 RepID=A0A1L9ND90_ASPTC|nr:hypothetical protein ASPTUDRAFT_188575 [Aspergillus tubingensis CBS 134.48]
MLGTVADVWGRMPVILIAMTIFLGGNQLCAAAPNVDVLAGRVFQGLGGPGMIWAVGSAVGPVLGGVSVTKLSWRWGFSINLPIGALDFAVLLLYLHVPNPRKPRTTGLKAIDWTGLKAIDWTGLKAIDWTGIL